MPVVAIGEGDELVLRIDSDNAAVAQRDAVCVVSITLLSIFLLCLAFFCKMSRRGVGRATLATQH